MADSMKSYGILKILKAVNCAITTCSAACAARMADNMKSYGILKAVNCAITTCSAASAAQMADNMSADEVLKVVKRELALVSQKVCGSIFVFYCKAKD
jgi:tRNA A37 threonylcarbamoyladenosine synthetase subunit TsaC/SUA5/YrdC